MTQAACTIVSLNYVPYARVLCDSFLRFHPDSKFYVLVVDRRAPSVDLTHESFETIFVEDLNIPDFLSYAFRYDILELNTNVKPTFLKHLLDLGIDQVIYLDPDIELHSDLSVVFNALQKASIVLTPHSISPDPDGSGIELHFLSLGIFNLGFIGLANCAESLECLDWWEDRCLKLGYNERRSGLFVDQKWTNLIPCYFDDVVLLKHPGLNVAYWNLHERSLNKVNAKWIVNESDPLIFFHFSGFNLNDSDQVSKNLEHVTLTNRPDLKELFEQYREKLIAKGIFEMRRLPYAFGCFSNGELVTRLMRSVYAGRIDHFPKGDPFDASASVYRWAQSNNLLRRTGPESAAKVAHVRHANDRRVRVVNAGLRLLLRMLGVDRYTLLLRYLSYITILRNQQEIFN